MVSNDGLKKQASVVESIPYMLTKNVENGIPAFPSWALTHIGASTIYSHSSGVNQIGLISGKVGDYFFFHCEKCLYGDVKSYLWGILGQWDILLLNLTSIGFTNFF